jgi:hypothetical protein
VRNGHRRLRVETGFGLALASSQNPGRTPILRKRPVLPSVALQMVDGPRTAPNE